MGRMTGKLRATVAVSLLMQAGFFGLAHAQSTESPAYYATLEFTEYYTDNVFFGRPLFVSPTLYLRRLGDWVTVIKPRVGYDHVYDKGYVNFEASAAIGRYATYTTENYLDLNFSASGRHRFSPTTIGVWGMGLSRGHEARNSLAPSDRIGIGPTVYWKASAYGALSHRDGDNIYKLGFTYDGFDYHDIASTVAPFIVNNDDRDRHMVTVGGRYTRRLSDRNSFYVDGVLDLRDYRLAADDNGYQRDSFGGRLSAGWQSDIGEYGRLELYGGLLIQTYRDPRFATVFTPDFGASYSWSRNGLSINAAMSRSIEETTLAGVSSYVRTGATLQVRQNLPGNFRIYAGLGIADLDFQGSGRRDRQTSAWIGARKYLAPHFYAGVEAAFEENDSSVAANDYTETRIMARLGVDTSSGFDPQGDYASHISISGFYLGAGGEFGMVGTMLDGPRQNTAGSLTADFGAFRPAGRFIAGWGADVGDTYFGVEAEARLANGGWSHARLPGGRVFSVTEKNSFAVSLLGGHRLPGGSLIYGRAGIRSTRFQTPYSGEGAAGTYQSLRLAGFEYGFGVRTPVTDTIALSLEYAHTRYPDYLAGNGVQPADVFANIESSVRFALTYHFGGIPGMIAGDQAVRDYAGAYWGLQGGLGALTSLVTGNRIAGAPPVASVLTAQYGDSGYTAGGLAGYNFQHGRFILGAEAEAEAGFINWKQERMPAGRSYSVAKQATLGGTARVGFVLNGGALLYGRAGVALSRFRIDFSNPGVTLAQTSWRAGLRFGGGVEVPVSEKSNLRFDYTYTDYGTLSLVTPPGTETYDTAESLFRVGYLRRF